MKLFIGLVGEKGSGKDTFAEIFQSISTEYSVGRSRSSDLLVETLNNWHIKTTRNHLQQMAIAMDTHFGKGTLTHALSERIKVMHEDIIVFDAVRWMSDVDLVNSFPNHILVYITADSPIRFERTKARNQKIGEATKIFAEFLQEELVSTETEIPVIGGHADVKIENNADIAQFKALVVEFYQQKVLPTLKRL